MAARTANILTTCTTPPLRESRRSTVAGAMATLGYTVPAFAAYCRGVSACRTRKLRSSPALPPRPRRPRRAVAALRWGRASRGRRHRRPRWRRVHAEQPARLQRPGRADLRHEPGHDRLSDERIRAGRPARTARPGRTGRDASPEDDRDDGRGRDRGGAGDQRCVVAAPDPTDGEDQNFGRRCGAARGVGLRRRAGVDAGRQYCLQPLGPRADRADRLGGPVPDADQRLPAAALARRDPAACGDRAVRGAGVRQAPGQRLRRRLRGARRRHGRGLGRSVDHRDHAVRPRARPRGAHPQGTVRQLTHRILRALSNAPALVGSARQKRYLAGAAMGDIYADPFDLRDLRAEPRKEE